MLTKSIIYSEEGGWVAMYKAWDKDKYRKVIRRNDKSIDIIQLGANEYKIYSSKPINSIELYYKSKSSNEPRPYYYLADKETILKVFKDLSIKLIDTIDSKTRSNIKIQ